MQNSRVVSEGSQTLRLQSYPPGFPAGRGVSGSAGNIPYAKERPWALAHSDVAQTSSKWLCRFDEAQHFPNGH